MSEAVQTIDVPIQVTLPFVVEIAETEDLKPYIYDIYLSHYISFSCFLRYFSAKIKISLFFSLSCDRILTYIMYRKEEGKC
jgi:hypothetical protein